MHTKWTFPVALLSIAFLFALAFADEDLIYKKCTGQSEEPAPWCYQREVEKIAEPDLCENILKYWPVANGVHGWCYYRIALKQKDCSLCKRIRKKDIRKLCIDEVCR